MSALGELTSWDHSVTDTLNGFLRAGNPDATSRAFGEGYALADGLASALVAIGGEDAIRNLGTMAAVDREYGLAAVEGLNRLGGELAADLLAGLPPATHVKVAKAARKALKRM